MAASTMPSPRRTAISLRIAAVAIAAAAGSLSAQGARGAGTGLLATATVVAPAFQGFAVTSVSAPAVRRPRPTSVEVISSVDVAGGTPYHLVVRPGTGDGLRDAGVRVWVRTRRGTFERLDASHPATVAGAYATAGSRRRTDLVFRIEADDPAALDALTIPVACEVVAQTDDAARAYRFVVVLRGD